uniref:Uncharacterized protein TCIL3000_11_9500 n=1 Tax=Trypanosoma congolense (strain IL3000) TaxID=1068625 RepID=G0V1G4_TRYCI|nr:unnamed protein product [Trypanosoma congolense IL3000]
MRSSKAFFLLHVGAGVLRGTRAAHGPQQALLASSLAWACAPRIQRCALHLTAPVRLGAEASPSPAGSGSGGSQGGAGDGVTALDVAMCVNKLKRLHQTGGGPSGKKQIELDAWKDLNSLTEEQINSADGKAVSLLLNSWAYFAKYWEKGAEGPATASTPDSGSTGEGSQPSPGAQ